MRIKEVMKERGITSKTLAARLNISEAALSQSINGNPTLERLTRIASALEVPLAELFERPDTTVITCPHCGRSIKLQVTK